MRRDTAAAAARAPGRATTAAATDRRTPSPSSGRRPAASHLHRRRAPLRLDDDVTGVVVQADERRVRETLACEVARVEVVCAEARKRIARMLVHAVEREVDQPRLR